LDLSQNFIAQLGEDFPATVQHVVLGSSPGPAKDGVDNSLNARAAGMQHSNPRIQQYLDLWKRTKDMISDQQRLHLLL